MMKLVSTAVCSIFAFVALSLPAVAGELQLKAGVIKGDGDVKPVARQVFTAYPWNPVTVVDELIAAKWITPPPNPADFQVKTEDTWGEYTKTSPDFHVAYADWKETVRSAFERLKTNSKKPVTFRTSLSGDATVALPDGDYYLFGVYEDSFTNAYWAYPLKMGKGTTQVELSNDNSVATGKDTAVAAEALFENVEINGGMYLSDPTIPEDSMKASGLEEVMRGLRATALIGALAFVLVIGVLATPSRR